MKSPTEDTKTQDYITTDGPVRSGAECEMTAHLQIGLCASQYQILAFSYIWVMFKEGFGTDEDRAQFSPPKPPQLNLLAAV